MTDNCLQICSVFIQGLEGYFRDPQFDQTTVRDSGKRKISCPGGGAPHMKGVGMLVRNFELNP